MRPKLAGKKVGGFSKQCFVVVHPVFALGLRDSVQSSHVEFSENNDAGWGERFGGGGAPLRHGQFFIILCCDVVRSCSSRFGACLGGGFHTVLCCSVDDVVRELCASVILSA